MAFKSSLQKYTGRYVSLSIRLGFLLFVLGLLFWLVTNRDIKLPVNDFTLYWSSSKLLLSGENPYDPEGLQEYQAQVTGTNPGVVLMYYPPWTQLVLILLGLVDRVIGQLVWVLVSTAVLVICIKKFWDHHGGSTRHLWLAWLVAFSFGPAFAALGFTGQITPFFLLGLTVFLLLIDKPEKDWITGLFLYFTAIKPQVLYLFFIILFLWAVHRRRWKLLAGFACSLGVATGLAMFFDPQIISHFFETLIRNTPIAWATPTIGTYLRYYLEFEGFWVQFIPPLIAGVLSVLYWWRKRETWDWQAVLPYVLFLSLITSPYTWTYDFVVLIIPLLIGTSLLQKRLPVWAALLLACFYIILNSAYWWLHLRYSDFYFIWFAPALFIWFIMAELAARYTPRVSRINLDEA